jgi:hypothetical protein
VLLLWAVHIGLAGDALHDMSGLAAGEPPAVAGGEQRACGIPSLLQPVVEHGAGVALHRHEVSELAAFQLDAGKSPVVVLVAVEL